MSNASTTLTATELTSLCSLYTSSYANTTMATASSSSSFNLFYVGLILAIAQSILNGLNYLFNKLAQSRLARRGVSAAQGSFRYLLEWRWWLSLLFSVSLYRMII